MQDGVAVEARWRAAHALRPELVAYGRRRGLTRAEAEDAASEAILRAATKTDLDLDRAAIWLRVVVAHLAVDAYRSRVPARVASRLRHQHEPDPDPHAEVDDRLEAEWVAELIDALPERQRTVIQQRAAGLSGEQIAAAMECSYKTVESLASRARAAVRRSLVATLGGVTLLRAGAARRASRVAVVPAALGGLAIGVMVLSTPPEASATAPSQRSAALLRAPGRVGLGLSRTIPMSVVHAADLVHSMPSGEIATVRLLPPHRLGRLAHGPVTVTRYDGNESMVQSAMRCLRDGPVISLDRVGCRQGA